MRTLTRLTLVCAIVAAPAREADARQPDPRPPGAVAFIGVNVLSMEDEQIRPGHTVLVRGDRIVAIGPDGQVPIPPDALPVPGTGRYLTPGLTDAHVHLNDLPFAHNRPNFGDAPMYLANGITTVINLSGSPTELDWRRRIAAGELVGPTIYTSGPFVNEPRVNTAEDVRREIAAQVHDGYDLIKFHELPGTTRGLTLEAYRAMVESARALSIPLVGHTPVRLGADVWLEAHQPIAHVGMLLNMYFLPVLANLWVLIVSAAAVLLLTLVALHAGASSLRSRRSTRRSATPAGAGRRVSIGIAAVLAWVAVVALVALLPGGPLFESVVLRVLVSVCTVALVVIAVGLLVLTLRLWRQAGSAGRAQATLAAIAAVPLAASLALFWTPVAWRSTEAGIAQFARRVREAGISVQSTLVVYETFNAESRAALQRDGGIDYLVPESRDLWRRLPAPPGSSLSQVGAFNRRVVSALSREGVPLVAGTDAMGAPLLPPGTSLHRELALLRASGLSPYQAIRAATVAPADFLRKQAEFGTVTVGKRADLLLVDGNPLEDVGRLKTPAGVMVRGTWLPRTRLQEMLTALRGSP